MTARQCLALAKKQAPIRRAVVDRTRRGCSLAKNAELAGMPEAWVSWVISTAWRATLPAYSLPVLGNRVYRPSRGGRAA